MFSAYTYASQPNTTDTQKIAEAHIKRSLHRPHAAIFRLFTTLARDVLSAKSITECSPSPDGSFALCRLIECDQYARTAFFLCCVVRVLYPMGNRR